MGFPRFISYNKWQGTISMLFYMLSPHFVPDSFKRTIQKQMR